MNLYLYKTGEHTPVLTIENVVSYTENQAITEDGSIYGPFANDVEFSSLPDCSEALRDKWRMEMSQGSEPTRLDFVEAQLAYTAMMTDTLLEA